MGFFDVPPRPPLPDEPFAEDLPPDPPWLRAPDNVLGGVVPVQLLLARSERAAVIIRDVLAYSSGCALDLVALRREPVEPRRLGGPHMFPFEPRYGWGRELPEDYLRFGVEFSDGSKATNLEGPFGGFDPAEMESEPTGPVLASGGGGGSDRVWHADYWVWPLPPPGPFAFVCEWPSERIELTRVEIDAALVRDAASRAEFLWGEDEERHAGGGRSGRISGMIFGSSRVDDDER